MAEKKPSASLLPPAELRRVLPLLAVLFALLAVWLGWGGVQQWRERRLDEQLRQARDAALDFAQQALAAQTKQLSDRLAAAPAQAALNAGDTAALARVIGQDWKGASEVQVLPTDLDAAYADPAQFGFSKLALLEAALSSDQAAVRVVQEDKQARLGLAAPAGGQVVYLDLPLATLTDSLQSAEVPGKAYVALRQGNYTIQQAGSSALSGGAEALARPVGKSGLRVVAATPDGLDGPMGLGIVPSLVVSALCAIFAIAALLAARG